MGDLKEELAIRTIPELKRFSSRKDLDAFSLLDALALDDRPTFVVDATCQPPQHVPLDLVYTNPSLARNDALLGKIKEQEAPGDMFSEIHAGFRNWLFGPGVDTEAPSNKCAYMFERHIWSTVNVDHYRVVSGVRNPAVSSTAIDPRERREPRNFTQLVKDQLPSTPPETTIASLPADSHGPYDYTLDSTRDLSAHFKYFHNVDWAATPLGPMRTWCMQLRCIVNIMMNDNHPAVLYWGEEMIMIYNEPYVELLGLLHPCMGASAKVALSDYWSHFQPFANHINATGQTLSQHDMPLFIDRHGFLEETFYSFQFVPILDSEGYVAGYYQPHVETTK